MTYLILQSVLCLSQLPTRHIYLWHDTGKNRGRVRKRGAAVLVKEREGERNRWTDADGLMIAPSEVIDP